MSLRMVTSVDFPTKPSMENYLDLLRSKAVRVLQENVYQGKTDTGYTAASGKTIVPGSRPRFLYPFQWLWDTFFIAGWSTDIKQGMADIRKFLSSQSPNGFLGHIRYNREILARKEYFPSPEIYYPDGLPSAGEIISKITQPPNVAYGTECLAAKICDKKRRLEFLTEVFPKIFKYHQYIYSNLQTDGLMVTIHPWQSGDDNSPKWDRIYESIRKKNIRGEIRDWLRKLNLEYDRVDVKIIHHSQRPINPDYDIYLYLIKLYNSWNWDEKTILAKSPFRVLDPLTNSLLQRSNLSLRHMATEIGLNYEIKIIDEWIRLTRKGLRKLWDEKEGLYFSYDINSKRVIKVRTISSLMPLFSHAISTEKAAILASNISEVGIDNPLGYLVPSTFPGQSEFEPMRYWRGSVWIIINAMLTEGLYHYSHYHLAQKLGLESLRLIYQTLNDNGGFYEYFDPLTGEGLGSPLQSWTAASVLFLTDLLTKNA